MKKNYINTGLPKEITENMQLKNPVVTIIIANKKYITRLTEFELLFDPIVEFGKEPIKMRTPSKIILKFDIHHILKRK